MKRIFASLFMVLALASCSKEGEVREIYLPQQIGLRRVPSRRAWRWV